MVQFIFVQILSLCQISVAVVGFTFKFGFYDDQIYGLFPPPPSLSFSLFQSLSLSDTDDFSLWAAQPLTPDLTFTFLTSFKLFAVIAIQQTFLNYNSLKP